MSKLSDADVEKLKHAPLGALENRIPRLLQERWSPRAFLEKPVQEADLRAILTAATWAASSYNEQPWRFFLGQSGDSTHAKLVRVLIEQNRVWAQHAPVLLLSVAKRAFSHTGEPNRFAMHDVGAATTTLALCATALGLHTHAMQGYDAAAARDAFAVPEDFEMGAVIALGYFGDHQDLSGVLLEREISARQRKPLTEIVFANSFGESVKLA